MSPLVFILLCLVPFGKDWKRDPDADSRDQNMRESFVVPVNSQRKEMAGNVILYVSPLSLLMVLSSHNPSSE